MKIVVKAVGKALMAYTSETDFTCPRCCERIELNVTEVPESSTLYKEGIRFTLDCRRCWYFGSPEGKMIEQEDEE